MTYYSCAKRVALLFFVFLATAFVLSEQAWSVSLKEILEDNNHDFVPDRIGQTVTVEGIINSDPNALTDSACFSSLQDETGGVLLFTQTPAVLAGKFAVRDKARITGTLQQYQGMEIIAVKSADRIGRGEVSAKEVSTQEINSEQLSGQLVRVSGELVMPQIISAFAAGLELRDAKGTVRVLLTHRSFQDTTFVSRMLKGGYVEITGIAGQSQTNKPYNSGYCIFPRNTADFIFLPPPSHNRIIIALSTFCVVGLVGYWWNRAHQLRKLRISIAERAHAQEALQASEQRFHNLAEISPVGIFNTDVKGCCIYVNKRWSEISGLSDEQARGDGWARGIHPKDRDRVGALWKECVEAQRSFRAEYRFQTANEVTTWVVGEAVIERALDGLVKGFLGTVTDITNRLEVEQALRESEERFRQLAENVQGVFWLFDRASKRLEYLSPVFERVWGCSRETFYACPQLWIEAVHPEDRERVRATVAAPSTGYNEIYRIVRPDGSLRWIHDRAFNVRNASGEIYRIAGVAEDITQQRKLEDELRQSQKMESVGRLAGGVAHDFNNILTVIQGHASLLLYRDTLDTRSREAIEQIGNAAERGANLTRQLLTFSRKQVMQMRILDLNDAVLNVTKMLRRVLGEDIALAVDYSSHLPLVQADQGMLEQVLINLVVNARDAMPKGGRLSVSTKIETVLRRDVDQEVKAASGTFVVVSVADTGHGIEPHHLPHIFEPFFTTKEVGKGTGLGLASAYAIIRQHQGWIEVNSEVGKGSTFKIFLPLVEEKAAADAGTVESEARGGIERILVVEDETSLRIMVRTILEHYGYTVVEASNGVAALELWEREKASVDLVLTDVVMPNGMTGLELVEKLCTDRPDLKVIFTSGYSAETVNQIFLANNEVHFIQKPYHPKHLARIVRNCLDQR